MQTSTMVTVIIPAYNAEKYIEQAIESVLSQDVAADIIVVDDCGQDNTAKALEKYILNGQIKYIKNEVNSGVAASRNKGIKLAETPYVAFLDADDWWENGKLQKQLRLLEEKNAVICCTGRELMSEDGAPMGKYIGVKDEITYDMLLRTNSIACSSVVLSTEVAREFYMTHDEFHEDYIMWLRILEKYGKCYGIDEGLLKSRMSGGGKSRNKFKSAKMQWGVYRLLGMDTFKSLFYMGNYIINGIRKYG